MSHANIDDRRAYMREWRRRNAERCKAYGRKRYLANPDRCIAQAKDKKLRLRYGINGVDHWEAIFDAQGRKCACCGSQDPSSRGWCVDHDHNNPEPNYRGIICTPCNIAVGSAKECSARLRACADYLDQHTRNSPPIRGVNDGEV